MSSGSIKRKLQADARLEPATKRHHLDGYDPKAPWLCERKPAAGWRMLGDPAVHSSLPLANMVSAVKDLIDPDFDPLTAVLDEEPRFLKPLPTRVAEEDLEFLRFRGALSIPESGLRNELLRSYTQWVHSFLPVLNLQEFLRCVAENDPHGNVSLLLFQAVMFVGTAFVDLRHLQAAGYSTRKSARNAFFTRLRLLYSLDCEEDRIVILQALLLMTYWSDPENSPQRDMWDWLGVCNTQAHSIGLNKDPSSSDMDPRTRRLRTRLWWCLYARDRLIAIGMRRPLQVNEGTSNVPMLKMEDFDFERFSPSVVAIFRCRQLEDVSHQRRLATMFIEKVKLCQCIGRVLFAQYAPSQRQFGATDRTTITLVPRQSSESEFARCSQKLTSWLSGLSKDAQLIPISTNHFRDGEDVLLLHGAMLRMLYHATSSALHRPRAAFTKDQPKSHSEWRKISRTKMHEAAAGITHIVQGLNELNLTRFLPPTGVTVILPAAVAHLSNAMSDNPAVRESSIYNFHRCIQVLHSLRDIYPAANTEFANIEAAIKLQSGGSNTFFQIMQYNADTTAAEKTRSCGSTSTTNSFRTQDSNPAAAETEASALRARPSSSQNQNTQPRKCAGPANQPSNTPNPSRSFSPNDFDFFTTPNSTNNNPFNYLSIEMNPSPTLHTPTDNADTTNIPAATQDLDTIDWTRELCGEAELLELDRADPFDSPRRRKQDELHHQEPPLDLEQDLFGFALKDDDDDTDGPQPQHQSICPPEGAITGDLDRDLGFQTGDEMF